jgi:hypothetical protein
MIDRSNDLHTTNPPDECPERASDGYCCCKKHTHTRIAPTDRSDTTWWSGNN